MCGEIASNIRKRCGPFVVRAGIMRVCAATKQPAGDRLTISVRTWWWICRSRGLRGTGGVAGLAAPHMAVRWPPSGTGLCGGILVAGGFPGIPKFPWSLSNHESAFAGQEASIERAGKGFLPL